MGHKGSGEHILTIVGPYILRFGSEHVLKIFSQRTTQSLNQIIGVCRTAPATAGLLIKSARL